MKKAAAGIPFIGSIPVTAFIMQYLLLFPAASLIFRGLPILCI